MNKAKLIKALKNLKVQTGSLTCHGCGHEHNCSTKGCAIIRAALEELSTSSLCIGDTVYFVECNHKYLGEPSKWEIFEKTIAEVGVKGVFISREKDSVEPIKYILYTEIGKDCFLTKSEAEKAKEAKEQEKICCNCNSWEMLPFFDGKCNCPQSDFYCRYIPSDRCCECFTGCKENSTKEK